MAWRQTVTRWHFGQLLIVWLGIVAVSCILFATAVVTEETVHANRFMHASTMDSVFLADMWDKRIADRKAAGGDGHVIGDYHPDSIIAFERRFNTERDSLRAEVMDVVGITRWAVMYPALALIPVLILSGFAMTWVWLGARSPRKDI